MPHLPTEAEQEELLVDLGVLISSRGSAAFLTSPIVLPLPRFLPDPWHGDLASSQVLLRRLMLYAGLDLGADLRVYDRDRGLYHQDAIAWFAGIEDGRCKFGLDSRQLEDPQNLIAALCHEIAHAYRELHGLCQDDGPREEKLTDLTTVYLGFGVLTANAADRFRQTGYLRGNMAVTETKFSRTGYLPVQSMSFLLAVQVVARNMPPAHRKTLARELETNQAEYLLHGVRHLEPRRSDILPRLGLPMDVSLFREADLARFTGPLDGDEKRISVLPDPELFADRKRKPDPDHTVFALKEGSGGRLLVLLLGVGLASWIGTMLGVMWESLPPSLGVWMGALAAVLLGTRMRQRHLCTDTECNTQIPDDATVCPGCGCRIGGRIRSKREIYANED